jgi:hypothetical protein
LIGSSAIGHAYRILAWPAFSEARSPLAISGNVKAALVFGLDQYLGQATI